MTPEEIKKTKRNLFIPMILGGIILLVAVLFHSIGSKRPGPQTMWFFVGLFGSFLLVSALLKLIKLHRFLKSK